MSLKVLAIVGGLVTVGAVGIPVVYTSLKDKTNRSHAGSKSEIWFDKNGICNYKSSSYSVSVGRAGERGLEQDNGNLCRKLFENDPDWKNWDINWNNAPESHNEKKAEWEKWKRESENSQTEQ